MSEITLVEAVNLALAHELEADPRVVLLGEDIGVNGGVFRATEGLLDRFGAERVVDTPLAETLIAGMSIGIAAQGLRPVAEIQFMGFIYPAIDQLLNHAARLRTAPAAGSPARSCCAHRRAAAFMRPSITPRAPRLCSRTFRGCASSSPPRPRARTACCWPRSVAPTRWCSWSRRGSIASPRSRSPTRAKRCRSMSASCCAKAPT